MQNNYDKKNCLCSSFFHLLFYYSTETLILRRNNQAYTELCNIVEAVIDDIIIMILSNKKILRGLDFDYIIYK
ncbi:hypothetical protein CLQ_10593 [Clostridium botulinum Af84]|nr:hypothetical protein CLQ_10593 [Clostridium botulinum Af84]